MESGTTLVLGASENPSRYSNMAIKRLRAHGIKVVAIGNKTGQVGDVNIVTDKEMYDDIHTITLYLNPANQRPYYEYILALKPKRIIFNPGTQNAELHQLAEENGIPVLLEACTLVMLGTGQY